jgi:hypothetical protein
MRILRLLRVLRIFKLARYSRGLQTFGDTMARSLRELSMLGMFLFTGIIFFSTVLFFLEKVSDEIINLNNKDIYDSQDDQNTKFISIPEACWWCVITMTTVGYGDIAPRTPG